MNNSPKLDYIWEQLYGTVSSLTTSDLTAKQRLLNAVESRLSRLFDYGSSEEPADEISQRLQRLHETFTEHGTFADSINDMDESEVTTSIESIFSLFNLVARSHPIDD